MSTTLAFQEASRLAHQFTEHYLGSHFAFDPNAKRPKGSWGFVPVSFVGVSLYWPVKIYNDMASVKYFRHQRAIYRLWRLERKGTNMNEVCILIQSTAPIIIHRELPKFYEGLRVVQLIREKPMTW